MLSISIWYFRRNASKNYLLLCFTQQMCMGLANWAWAECGVFWSLLVKVHIPEMGQNDVQSCAPHCYNNHLGLGDIEFIWIYVFALSSLKKKIWALMSAYSHVVFLVSYHLLLLCCVQWLVSCAPSNIHTHTKPLPITTTKMSDHSFLSDKRIQTELVNITLPWNSYLGALYQH